MEIKFFLHFAISQTKLRVCPKYFVNDCRMKKVDEKWNVHFGSSIQKYISPPYEEAILIKRLDQSIIAFI